MSLNRIVVDYEDTDDLFLIGQIDNETGAYDGPEAVKHWYGPKVETFWYPTLNHVLNSPPRTNAEGFVIWFDRYTPVKFKYEAYKELHRIVSSLNLKEVWRQLSAGTFREFAEALPDEFHQWARDTSAVLMDQYRAVENQVLVAWDGIAWAYAEDNRRVFAEEAKKHGPLARYLFLMYDEKDIESAIWRSIEPKGSK